MAPKITCECGTCKKCKHRAYMRDYYRREAGRVRATAKASRDRRIEKARAYDRERGFRVYDAEKVRVRAVLHRALRHGLVERRACEVCGEPQTDAHHDNYSRPLDVRWLCRAHHMELHRVIA